MRQLLTIILIIFHFCSVGNPILQKGFPFIQNFEINRHSADLQSWMSAQAPNGFIYVANSSKLLEFDGVSWHAYTLPNNSALRSVAIDETGRIFVGGTREFGYFYPDEYGRLEYYSLSANIEKINFESVWRVLKTPQGIYFVAGRKYIYKFNGKGLTIITAPPIIQNFRASMINDTIYFYDIYAGFGAIVNDTMRLLKNSRLPSDFTPYFFIKGKNSTVATGIRQKGIFDVDYSGEFYSWKESLKIKSKSINTLNDFHSLISPVNKELNKMLSQAELYYGFYNDETYFFTSLRKGLFIADKDFRFLNNFKKGTGLQNDAVFHVNVDKNGGVWITGEMGVSYIRYQNPFVFFNQRNNINGIVISVKSIADKILIGTTQGLFMMDDQISKYGNIHHVQQVTDKYAYITDMQPLSCCEHEVLIGSLRELLVFNYKTNTLTPIYKLYGTYDIAQFPENENIYAIGTTEGVKLLKVEKLGSGKYIVEDLNVFKKFNQNIRNLLFDKNNRLWMSTAYNGVYMAEFDSDGNINEVKKYGTDYGLNYDDSNLPLLYNDTLLMVTRSGVLYHNTNDNMFKAYRDLYNNPIFDSVVISDMKIESGKIWFSLEQGVMYYDLKRKKFERSAFNRLNQYGAESMEIDKSGLIWLTCLNNLIAIDTTYLSNQYNKTPVYFRNIVFGHDSLYKNDLRNQYVSSHVKAEGIPFENNSLSVSVACPAFQTLESIEFSYRLKGLNENWSDWTNNNVIKYNYLPGGDYILEVQARDANLQILGKAVLTISIDKPFYYSFLAIIIYILIGLFLIYFLVKLNSKRLQNDKKRLQDAINDAIYTVKQQKEELEQQAEFLSDTNKELEKMSIVAEYTDNAVAIMDGKGNYQWVNKGFTRMYGYEYEELVRDDDRSKIGRNANLRMNDLINIWFGDKKPIVYESLNKCRDGAEIWVQTTLTPILDSKGNVVKLISIDTDIRKLKQAEKQIENQRDEIGKQRDLAYVQRDEILQQKKEITDSIHYAQRIQNALFPTKGSLDAIFESNFIFDLPRDIVSGDFFWTYKNDDLSMLAVADCTGHGVPGAFMSLIGLNFLNDIVKNQRVFLPDQVLNRLRERIITGLKQTTEVGDNKDGMDIAFITFDKKSKTLKYAGANNLAILKRGEELIMLEPDKMPISIFRDIKEPFTIKTFEVQENDILYMFTDGYTDQFGGSKGKKFKTTNLKKLLKQINSNDLKLNENIVKDNFYTWKGDLEQVDDVLFIGIKIG